MGTDGSTLVERRGAGNLIAGFLAAALILATVRGAAASPIAAAITGAAAVVVVVIWVVWRRKPAAHLLIAPAAIRYARGDRVVTSWASSPGARLRLRRRRGGAFLALVDGDSPAINLMGFDLRAVAQACVDNGWRFDT
jgi:hypothetical protein